MNYLVKPSDTLSKVAYKVYGQTKMWTQIASNNSSFIKDPHSIYPGDVLKVPLLNDEAKSFSNKSKSSNEKITVTVKKGDTLWSLAKKHLGDGANWRTIWSQVADQVVNPDLIEVGQTITFNSMGSSGG